MSELEHDGRAMVQNVSPGMVSFDAIGRLLNDEALPEEFRNRFWVWGSPELALSNKTRQDVNRSLARLDVDRLLAIAEYTSKGKMTYKMLSWLNELRELVEDRLLRSTGGDDRDRSLFARTRTETEAKYREEIAPQKRGIFHRGQ